MLPQFAGVEHQIGSAGSPDLSRPIAFAAITAIFVLFAAAASAPTPLYVVYQKEWGFTDTTLTVIFAVYVLGLVGSLLVLGGLSELGARNRSDAARMAESKGWL